MRVVFMGTPDFAVYILKSLMDSKHEVLGVVTTADKPAGRGRKIHQSAVKVYADQNDLPTLQPEKLKDEGFISDLKAFNADLFVVVAFRMLPEVVWQMPKMGTMNLHGSLLPDYRGAAPINWAIINGESKSGITTFFIEKEIDTGNILLNKEVEISENMTAGELHDLLAEAGGPLVVETLNRIEGENIEAKPQSNYQLKESKHAPKIFKDDCLIDWKKSAKQVHDFIRGLSPFPGAHTFLYNPEGKKLQFKISDTECLEMNISDSEIKDTKEGYLFACSDKYILVKGIQMEGKRKMSYLDFRAGNNLEEYSFKGSAL
jgi:methionyl-tRNA formyltransferase